MLQKDENSLEWNGSLRDAAILVSTAVLTQAGVLMKNGEINHCKCEVWLREILWTPARYTKIQILKHTQHRWGGGGRGVSGETGRMSRTHKVERASRAMVWVEGESIQRV